MTTTDPAALLARARELAAAASSDAEAQAIIRQVTAQARKVRSYRLHGGVFPPGPLEQAMELDPKFKSRPHLAYLSERVADAVHRVEAGENVRLRVSFPARHGKTRLLGEATPVWVLRKHPDWSIVTVAFDSALATLSGRAVRRTIENDPGLGVTLAPDAGAVTEWQTTEWGGMVSRGLGGSLTGRGARVLILDDLVKDFAGAHSQLRRQAVWDWWLTVAQMRLEPPSLVIALMTRWHEDDFLGRLGSHEHEGDPADWEDITIPGIAEEGDLLGRAPGEPLFSPLLDETPEEALARWAKVKTDVGTYAFNAMVQQHPSPAQGAIFNPGWFKFWTVDPARAEANPDNVILLDPATLRHDRKARWTDSWDCAFKDTDGSDYVVGQQWVKIGVRRILVKQHRARLSFVGTKKAMVDWADTDTWVYERLVEDKANGTAVINVLTDEVEGMIAVNPTQSKSARAYAVTPDAEAGNVYLPHPSDPGNEWVTDLLSELREFPNGLHDDQVDALTQYLNRVRDQGLSSVTVPTAPKGANPIARSITQRSFGPRATGGSLRGR